MALTPLNGEPPMRYSSHDVDEMFAALQAAIPGLQSFQNATKLSVLLDKAECREFLQHILHDGFSDVCIPFLDDTIPKRLSPGAFFRLKRSQGQFLFDHLPIPAEASYGQHFQLSGEHLRIDHNNISRVPTSLTVVKQIGDGGFGFVEGVKDNSTGSRFALKRIERFTRYKESVEQMRYVKEELDVLKKIRNKSPHYVSIICGYTDPMYYGILMEPWADCNLSDFLNKFWGPDSYCERDESLLMSFFGCLATALAYLHFHSQIRHKDIKPANILVRGRNVLLTDFGMALDWSGTGHTTTAQEQRRSPKYAAPETDDGRSRGSKADIWPLGCVFLEMLAVLKKMTTSDIADILDKNGGGSPNYRANFVGTQIVIETLKERESSCGNAPLKWIEAMLRADPRERPDSQELRNMIFGSKLQFWGNCCRKRHLFAGDHEIQALESRPSESQV